jgi:hypothetical protein
MDHNLDMLDGLIFKSAEQIDLVRADVKLLESTVATQGLDIDALEADVVKVKEDIIVLQSGTTTEAAITELTNNLAAEVFARESGDANLQVLSDNLLSQINTEITNRQTQIAQEVTDRKAADLTESLARSSADSGLASRIDQETIDRIAADGALNTRIDGLAAYGTDLTTLQADLTQEIADREAADTTLSGLISQETTDRTSADTAIQTSLTQEIAARKSAVTAEATTRFEADTALQGLITNLQNQVTNLESASGVTLETLTLEATARAQSDADLQNEITTEISNRTTADNLLRDTSTTIQTNLTNEVNARIAADAQLQANIDAVVQNGSLQAIQDLQTDVANLALADTAETNARIAAVSEEATARLNADNAETLARTQSDTNLQTAITNEQNARIAAVLAEATARSDADTLLTTNLNAEITDRTNADTALQNQINNMSLNPPGAQLVIDETNARIAADNTLQTNLTAEKDARIAADSALQTQITNASFTRQTVQVVTAAIAPNASDSTVVVTLAKSASILKISTDHPAWVRFYNTDANRVADISRVSTVDPSPGSGVMAEFGTSDLLLSIVASPPPIFSNADKVVNSTAYLTVTNLDTQVRAITVTITYLPSEV